MKDVVVIGAGKIGSAVAGALASTGDYQVTLADRSPEVLDRLGRNDRIRIMPVDVEDSAKLLDLVNSVDRTVQRRSAGKQGQRIEIALNRPPLLDHRPRKLKLDRPIKPDRIDCNRVEIATCRTRPIVS